MSNLKKRKRTRLSRKKIAERTKQLYLQIESFTMGFAKQIDADLMTIFSDGFSTESTGSEDVGTAVAEKLP